MFEKNMKYAYLVDVYGALLDPHARGVMDAYYNEDLSLSEIAEGEGISRQGVRHIIKRAEELLELYENALRLTERERIMEDALYRLRSIAASLRSHEDGTQAYCAEELEDVIRTIQNNK